MLLKRGYYYLTVKRCMYMETIALFPILVSSSKAKRRRKQEESVQRFNRISCTGRATPRPQLSLPSSLSLSFPPAPSVSLFLFWLDIGLIAGERRMCWSGEWDYWDIWKYRWHFTIDRTVGFKIISTDEKGLFCQSDVFPFGWVQDRDYCHCSLSVSQIMAGRL